MRACVVVPTYNERENVARLVREVAGAGEPELHILFVDDNSPDGTQDEIRKAAAADPSVHLLAREAKKGIGSAYIDGFREAIETLHPDVLLEMDADMQHPPSVIPELVKAVADGAGVAVASRYVPGGGTSGWGIWRRTVSRTANGVARGLLGIKVKDCTSGFRAYSRECAAALLGSDLPAKGFEFQVATLYALKGRAEMREVPYVFGRRRAGRSKLGAADMMRFLAAVVRMAVRGQPAAGRQPSDSA